MRSRSARLLLVAVAWIAIGSAAFYVFSSQQKILIAADRIRSVDQHSRESADALADVRVAQQSYVAAGQGVAFWMPKVAERSEAFNAALNALRESTTEPAARSSLDEAAAAMHEFVEVDKRARDYMRSGQSLMASDVIFSEASQLAAVAAQQVQTARQSEHQAYDAAEAEIRKAQAMAVGGAAALAALIAFALGVTGPRSAELQPKSAMSTLSLNRPSREGDEGVVSHARSLPVPERTTVVPSLAPAMGQAATRNASMLKAAANLATDFGRVRDSAELERLLGRASDLLDAGGLVVWLGDGNDALKPVLTHGYTPQMLTRMQSIPRTADNAAAAAVRTGSLQIVLSRPGGSSGAIVAPILGADGCVGALSAEIKGGGEGSEAVQAVAAIVAAHLASVLSAAPAETEAAQAAQA